MASIRKRGDTWQARVIRKGFPDETKTFNTKVEAERWSRDVESKMDSGRHVSMRAAESTTFGELLQRYRGAVTPLKRGATEEAIRLRALERHRMARLALINVTPEVIARFRDERLQACNASTVIRDLAVLSSIFNHARREWGLAISNPVQLVRKPVAPPGRDRTLSAEEEARLLAAAEPVGRRSPVMKPLLIVALETAMRRGELLALRWEHVHLGRCYLHLPLTKNGSARDVPLSRRAVSTLEAMPRSECGEVFPIRAGALEAAFHRLRTRASLLDLRLHDLRHTATTRMSAKLPNVIELAAVTGHQSLQMLKRYYHPTAEFLAAKLG